MGLNRFSLTSKKNQLHYFAEKKTIKKNLFGWPHLHTRGPDFIQNKNLLAGRRFTVSRPLLYINKIVNIWCLKSHLQTHQKLQVVT